MTVLRRFLLPLAILLCACAAYGSTPECIDYADLTSPDVVCTYIDMYDMVANLRVPYIMMHMRGIPSQMMEARYLAYDNVVADVLQYFAAKIERLTRMGINDIIIDPGFGFSKTVADNYKLMRHLDEFLPLGLPILVGVSRKSMIYKFLGISPEESINGTTALHVMALLGGADILRVHDVRPAVEAVKIVMQTLNE